MTSSSSSTNIGLKVGIVALTLGTAVIHLQLNFPDPIFILNGLGYLGLLAALYLPVPRLEERHNAVRWVMIGYAALTIVMWVILGERTIIGYADKVIEVVLIFLLILEARAADRRD